MAFWDSSAIVPLCVYQQNSVIARRLSRKFREKFAWQAYVVEVSSALARLQREGLIDATKHQLFQDRLIRLEAKFIVISEHDRIIELARTFPSLYGLKAMDSLQLAAALVWCKEYPNRKDFVSADERLLAAAESAGFTVHGLS
jgi:predicted nucleic acid-binding protein